MGETAPHDWTPGPAKWVAVLILTGLIAAGMTHAITARSTPWRTPHDLPLLPLPRPETPPPEPPPTPAPKPASAPEPSPAPSVDQAAAPAAHAAKPTLAAGVKININTATKAELELLPRIGPSLADRIIAERERGGPFKRLEDLDRVRGIGPKTLQGLRDHVVFE